MTPLEKPVDKLTGKIIGCAIKVHETLGPGLLESIYEACLFSELEYQGLKVERQKVMPVFYRNLELADGYRLDLVVEDMVIVEIKAVDVLNQIHKAQVSTYLKLSKYEAALLLNFDVRILSHGIFRINPL